MGYIEGSLTQNERIVTQAKSHWWTFAPATFVLLAGVWLLAAGGELQVHSSLSFLVALYLYRRAWLRVAGTELAVTNTRVIAKFGLIGRHTIELNHAKVEGFHVERCLIG